MAQILKLFNDYDLPLMQKSWAPSPCPFLSSREIEFLWGLYSRTDSHMNNPYYGVGYSAEGRALSQAGYTREVHQQFKQLLKEPEKLTKDFLHPLLSTLQDFYEDLLKQEFKCQRHIFSTYENLFNLTAINPKVAYDIDRDLRNLSADNNYCNHRISSLVKINNNIRALLHRPTQAEINLHPTYERSIA